MLEEVAKLIVKVIITIVIVKDLFQRLTALSSSSVCSSSCNSLIENHFKISIFKNKFEALNKLQIGGRTSIIMSSEDAKAISIEK